MRTKQSYVIECLSKGEKTTNMISDECFDGDRKECKRFLEKVLISDGIVEKSNHRAWGQNWYKLTEKGKQILSMIV